MSREVGSGEIESLVLLYEEVGRNFRHYLSWRRLLLAGYFATIAGLAIGFGWCVDVLPEYEYVVPLSGVVASGLFWALDFRNHDLFAQAAAVGSDIESKLGYKGYYAAYRSGRGHLTHTSAITVFFTACTVVLLALTVALKMKPL